MIRLVISLTLFCLCFLPIVSVAQDAKVEDAPSKVTEGLFHEGIPSLGAVASEQAIPNFASLAKALSGAVVNLSVEGGNQNPGTGKDEKPQEEADPMAPFRSSGSGFLISPDGYIISCNHVVEKSDKVIVRLLNDKTEYSARVVGKDKKTDIALLKIESSRPLPYAHLGDSEALEVGEWAIAIGNQFELGQTVTVGIVSAKARKVPSKDSGPYDKFIQTDASINPGSSGGPLFNIKGQVIGVNTAIFTPARGGVGFNIGIGFAVPINLVKDIASQLRKAGKVTRGMLGVMIQPISKDMSEALGVGNQDGALVAEVVKEGPADKAGFLQRDVVVAFDNRKIEDYDDLPRFVAESQIGKAVTVKVIRAGKEVNLTPTIAELKEQVAPAKQQLQKPDLIGLRVDIVPEEIKRAFKIATEEGVVVLSVEPNSVSEKAGLTPGDIILEFAGERVRGLDGYLAILKKLPKDKAVLISVQKKDGIRFLAIKVGVTPGG